MSKKKLFKIKATQLLEAPKFALIKKSPIGILTLCVDGVLYKPEIRWLKMTKYENDVYGGMESWEDSEGECCDEPSKNTLAIELDYKLKEIKK